MRKKVIFLFLALLLPGLIFLFLKKFGRNTFDIPSFYTNATDSLNRVCNTNYPAPYSIPDSVFKKIGLNDPVPVLFVFNATAGLTRELSRVADVLEGVPAEFKVQQMSAQQFGSGVFTRWTSCVFFVAPPRDIILVDKQRRIRGYYNGSSREDIDRLIVEMKILLIKY